MLVDELLTLLVKLKLEVNPSGKILVVTFTWLVICFLAPLALSIPVIMFGGLLVPVEVFILITIGIVPAAGVP